jgi:glycosyltransferase involved in cell wall biosynthesis
MRKDLAHILFVDHATALGGAEISMLTLLDQLDRSRFVPHLATLTGKLAEAGRRRGLATHEVPLHRLWGQATAPWRLARGAFALSRVVRNQGIDLIVANTMRASVYAGAAALLTRRPLIWHVHDIFRSGVYVETMSRVATLTVAVSRAAAAPLPCPKRVRVVYNGVRVDRLLRDSREERSPVRAKWGVPNEAVLIGQVARLQPWKGQRDVIAATELLRDLPNTYVAIIGGDIFQDSLRYERQLKEQVRSKGLAERIVFTGHQENMSAVFAALDVVVHASDNEPFGRVLVEAGAAGLPVVAYASGASPELVQHEVTGILVEPKDIAALAGGIRRLVTHPALACDLGRRAREVAQERFDAPKIAREFEELFTAVLEGRLAT